MLGIFKVLGHCGKQDKASAFCLFYRERGNRKTSTGFHVAKIGREIWQCLVESQEKLLHSPQEREIKPE